MNKKRLFRSIASAMLLGVFTLSSCVQMDNYELYDDDSECLFVRRKSFKDNGNGSDPYQIAKDWVNKYEQPAPKECFTYALHLFSGKTMAQIRNTIGPVIFDYWGHGNHWEQDYFNCVVNGPSLPTFDYEKESWMIGSVCGAYSVSWTDWNQYLNSHIHGEYIDKKVLILLSDIHCGVLTGFKVDRWGNVIVKVHDQYGTQTEYDASSIDSVYW